MSIGGSSVVSRPRLRWQISARAVCGVAVLACAPRSSRVPHVDSASITAISQSSDPAFSRCAGTPTPLDTVTPAFEPYAITDPNNTHHVVVSWSQRARFGVGVIRSAVSFDGAVSWQSLTTLPFTQCANPSGLVYRTAGDPWLAAALDGRIYASALAAVEDSVSGIVVTTSVDGGRSWRAPVVAMASTEERAQYDNSSLAVDPRDPLTAFVLSTRMESTADGGRMGLAVVSKTVDGGAHWSVPRVISPKSPDVVADLPQMVIDPNTHTLFVVYTTGPRGQVWLVRSTDGGESWTQPTQIMAFVSLNHGPRFPGTDTPLRITEDVARLDIDARTGRLFVTIVDGRFTGGDYPQVGITTSSDSGRTWTPVVRASSDSAVATWQPASAVLPDGTLAMTFFASAGSPDRAGQVYPTAVWVARVRLADDGRVANRIETRVAVFPWQPGPRKTGMFLGDYHALVRVGDKFCPVFARSFGTASGIVVMCADFSRR